MPTDADYSFPLPPARICSEGSRHREDLRFAFGGVVALSAVDFERVNGYSNCCAGRGYEDSDLLLRVVRVGMRLESRPGRFLSLPHAPSVRDPDGRVRPETRSNPQRFLQRLGSVGPFRDDDGPRSLVYTVERRQQRARAGRNWLEVHHAVVQIDE